MKIIINFDDALKYQTVEHDFLQSRMVVAINNKIKKLLDLGINPDAINYLTRIKPFVLEVNSGDYFFRIAAIDWDMYSDPYGIRTGYIDFDGNI